jgi:hypothetical protein
LDFKKILLEFARPDPLLLKQGVSGSSHLTSTIFSAAYRCLLAGLSAWQIESKMPIAPIRTDCAFGKVDYFRIARDPPTSVRQTTSTMARASGSQHNSAKVAARHKAHPRGL